MATLTGGSEAEYQSASDYLKHCYDIPDSFPPLPPADEPFVDCWEWRRETEGAEQEKSEVHGRKVLEFLAEGLGLHAGDFPWDNPSELRLGFVQTLAGRLPVITTGSHADFRRMEALVNGRGDALELPVTVNAFTIQARAKKIRRHRLILLNHAPYSNIPAKALGLAEEDWIARSRRLRLRHECAHYETLRLLGGMENHALDEIVADAMGQIAAFGGFDADRQRLFFGLTRGKSGCTGRLSFYCQTVHPEERDEAYRAVDEVLDGVAAELGRFMRDGNSEIELLKLLAGRSVLERTEPQSSHA